MHKQVRPRLQERRRCLREVRHAAHGVDPPFLHLVVAGMIFEYRMDVVQEPVRLSIHNGLGNVTMHADHRPETERLKLHVGVRSMRLLPSNFDQGALKTGEQPFRVARIPTLAAGPGEGAEAPNEELGASAVVF